MNFKALGLLLCLILCSALNAGTIQVKVYAALGPDWQSSSYDAWAANVLNQVENANGASNPVAGPTGYTNVAGGTISHGDMITTYGVFPSWRGDTPPPAGFAGEGGNYLYFPFSVEGLGGEQVNLNQIRVVATSNNAYGSANYLGDSYDYGFADYAQDFIGVANGNPVLVGTSSDTPVDAVYYTGYGVAFFLDPSFGNPSDQAGWLNYTEQAAWLLGNFSLKVCVFADNGNASASNCASVGISDPNAVPEPGTWAMLGCGLLGVAALRRFRRN
jgi:hypothetical protein